MRLLLPTVVIVRILFALSLPSLIGVPSILAKLFDALELLLLPAKLLLLLFIFFLLLLLLPLVLLFTLLLLNGGTHVHILSILSQNLTVLPLLPHHLLIQRLSVLLYRIFSILIDRDFDDSIILQLLLRVLEILQIGMPQRLLNRYPMLRIKE